MSAPLAFLALDVAAIVCAVLLGLRVLVSGAGGLGPRLVVAIAACNVCYIVLGRDDYAGWIPPAYRIAVGGWQPILNVARNLTPGLFMVLSHTLFHDGRRFPRWLLALFAVQVALEGPARALIAEDGRPGWVEAAAASLEALFAAAAIGWALGSWRADLVETRRRLRAATVLVVGLDVVVASLLQRVLIAPGDPASYAAQVVMVGVDLAILAFLLLLSDRSDFARYLAPPASGRETPAAPGRGLVPSAAGAEPRTAAELNRLSTLLEVERIYRQPGLSLKALADQVGVPEYRLRKLIHEALGFRNFNLFLHHYRIGEAREQLADPALRRTPILTIALSVGYQSVNTFNRGFAEIMGVTPSAYRAEAAAASAAGASPRILENDADS